MVKDRNKDLENPSDREYLKQQMKAIKRAKASGKERKAQRLADELYAWLGWE